MESGTSKIYTIAAGVFLVATAVTIGLAMVGALSWGPAAGLAAVFSMLAHRA